MGCVHLREGLASERVGGGQLSEGETPSLTRAPYSLAFQHDDVSQPFQTRLILLLATDTRLYLNTPPYPTIHKVWIVA